MFLGAVGSNEACMGAGARTQGAPRGAGQRACAARAGAPWGCSA